MKTLLKTTSFLILFLFWSGCAKFNPQDPEQVAQAAWKAIAEKDIDAFQSLVLPGEREDFPGDDFAKELERLPPFPEEVAVRVEMDGEDEAEAFLENWEFEEGLNMKRDGGRWWIVR